MKIFNWVHRRFNNKAENAKRNGDIAAGDEKFPAEDKCDDVFERWRGGILAIGTFGFDPLQDKNEQLIAHDYFLEDDGDHSSVKDDDNGDDEGNPLVLAVDDCNAEELTETETETEENDLNHEDELLQFGFEYVMMKKKERTTLADLFTADSGDQDRRAAAAAIAKNRTFIKSDLLRKKSSRKHALSFTAKDARPIHKLNKLMRRMLRRKIHPEVGPTNPKVAALNNYNYNCNYNYDYNYNDNDKCRATDDNASLLPIQDTNI